MVPEILFRPSDIGIQQVNPLDEAWSHFAVMEKKKKYGNYTHKFGQLLTRWDSRKLLWKVCLPVIQQHSLGCTGEVDQ